MLDVSGNRLQALPEEMQQLGNLKTLHAQANALQSTPDLSALVKLQTITLNENRLQHDALGSFPPNLVTLNLARNRISALPVSVIGLSKLQTLDLSQNQLAELDGGVSYCVGLVELILDDNMLSELPEELARLPALKTISLAHNRIAAQNRDGKQSIPAAIFVQTPLQKLVLTGNPISKVAAVTPLNNAHSFQPCLLVPGNRVYLQGELFQFSGIDAVLDRRKQVKDRSIQVRIFRAVVSSGRCVYAVVERIFCRVEAWLIMTCSGWISKLRNKL